MQQSLVKLWAWYQNQQHFGVLLSVAAPTASTSLENTKCNYRKRASKAFKLKAGGKKDRRSMKYFTSVPALQWIAYVHIVISSGRTEKQLSRKALMLMMMMLLFLLSFKVTFFLFSLHILSYFCKHYPVFDTVCSVLERIAFLFAYLDSWVKPFPFVGRDRCCCIWLTVW